MAVSAPACRARRVRPDPRSRPAPARATGFGPAPPRQQQRSAMRRLRAGAPFDCMMVRAMDRREFLQLVSASPLLATETQASLPVYHVVTPFAPEPGAGMPGAYRGQVARVHAASCIDEKTDAVDREVVRRMLSSGMRALTGEKSERDAWARFIAPKDVVGIKVNSSGAPNMMSMPELVAGIVENVIGVGVPPENIWIYERMGDQMRMIHYDRFVPAKVNVWTAEHSRSSILGYEPRVYVDVDFFGEDDTRSCLVRLVSEKLTKIINVPNMKEHQAAGVTGCLKNISYGNFSNVARSHRLQKTNTYSFIGTLAAVEPVRSRTVLNIMDGLGGVARGTVQHGPPLPLLSKTDHVRQRSGRDGPPAHRCDRGEAPR